MTIKLTKEQFDRAVNGMMNNKFDGTWHCKVGECNGRDVAIVLGWSCDYDDGDAQYQIRQFGKTWSLCGKVAFNTDDLQCDFDYDWSMPTSKGGDVYDTEHAIDDGSFDYLKDEAEFVMIELARGTMICE